MQCERETFTKHQDEKGVMRDYKAILKLVECAKLEWQFSTSLLDEATDPDLIDYAVFLIKSNEARYRYLLKLARQEHMCVIDNERKSMTFS